MDLDIDRWIERLRSQVGAPLLGVDGAAELAAIQAARRVGTPYAWVIPVGEQAGGSALLSAVSQRVVERVGVVIAVANRRDARGEAAHNTLRAVRRAIKDTLIGWLPDPAEEAVTYSRGRLLDYNDHVLWWQDEYLGAFDERAV